MDPQRLFVDWIGTAMSQVASDVTLSRKLMRTAVARLTVTFDEVSAHAGDLGPAIEALQFDDVVAQLLEGVLAKLEAVRQTCLAAAAAADPGDPRIEMLRELAQSLIDRDQVSQGATDSGSVELF